MKTKQFPQQTKPDISRQSMYLYLLSSDDHDEKYQEFLKTEKNIDLDAIKHNIDKLTN